MNNDGHSGSMNNLALKLTQSVGGVNAGAAVILNGENAQYEGSFECLDDPQRQKCIVIGAGLLICHWNKRDKNKLKLTAFYDWNQFYSIYNRPNKREIILTLNNQKNTKNTSSRRSATRNDDIVLKLITTEQAAKVAERLSGLLRTKTR